MLYKVAPLKSSFMLFSMLGFMITVVYTSFGTISETWGFTFGLVFAVMFISALRSMTYADIDSQLEMDEHIGHHAKKTQLKSRMIKKSKKQKNIKK